MNRQNQQSQAGVDGYAVTIHLAIHLYTHFCVCLSTPPPIHPPTYQPSIHLSFHPFILFTLDLPICPPIHGPTCSVTHTPRIHLLIYPSESPCMHPSIHPSTPVYPPMHPPPLTGPLST